MYKDKKIIVVMPAYNAEQTLRKTWEEVMAQEIVDLVIVVDDGSRDETVSIAKELPDTLLHIHDKNLGYGGNQKTCYRLALEAGGDIIFIEVSGFKGGKDLTLTGSGAMHAGYWSTRLGIAGMPRAGEDAFIFRDVELARATKGHLHVAHVSTAGAVEIIRRAVIWGSETTASMALMGPQGMPARPSSVQKSSHS